MIPVDSVILRTMDTPVSTIYNSPVVDTVSPAGLNIAEFVAETPVYGFNNTLMRPFPFPAIVVMIPKVEIIRIREDSPMYNLPKVSPVIDWGELRLA